jgi:TolB-like protein/class 3 adenylate cyclase/tetratricopeptide (TPR) repeat protein
MASDQLKRKLAAILAADIAGYSRLMGADEAGTLARLKQYRRELIDPKNKQYRGRVVKTTGDGILIEFPSVVDAVSCSIEVQQGMRDRNADVPPEKRIEFRVGINLGDVIVEGRDLFGDGVNIAARLEGIAEPGGICISQTVLNHARGKIAFDVEDLGERALKNIVRPVHVYRVLLNANRGGMETQSPELVLALPDKPSIAVLPFQNMSGDPEQEYFTDGMVEEIITGLSRMHWLFVIARNSSFAYKGKSPDVRQVGRELGVRYVLEGSVRKAANRLRITGQLIDASTGAHLWADRFEGGVEDVFELQDHVTSRVIGAIAPKLEQAEIERAKHKPTDSLDAYDYYLRGLASVHRWSKEGVGEALQLFHKAIELDPDFASAHGLAAWCYFWRRVNGWMTDQVQEVPEAIRLAGRAAELGKDDAVALSFSGLTIGWVGGDVEAAAELTDRALVLNPNLAAAWSSSGFLKTLLGDPEVGIGHLERAMRISPLDPMMFFVENIAALAHFLVGRYDEAWQLAERACRKQPYFLGSIRVAAAGNAAAGRLDHARKWITRALQLDPELRVSNLKDRVSWFRPEDFTKYVEALRKAGLPE